MNRIQQTPAEAQTLLASERHSGLAACGLEVAPRGIGMRQSVCICVDAARQT